MTTPQPTEVEIHVAEDGRIRPLRFHWGEDWLVVGQVGRNWSDEAGDHWLVMVIYPQRQFELIRTPVGLWLAAPSEPSLA